MPPYASLTSEMHFPTWQYLPGYRPSTDRHYCFLAEVKECDGFFRYRTLATDGIDQDIVVAFYPSSYEGFDWKKLRKGHTLAIMDATQHHFLDSSHGVRVENLDHVYVFPASQRDLQRLSSEVNEFAPETEGGPWRCHGCHAVKPMDQMSRCGKCKVFGYCSKDCQVKGWNEKDHKRYCKVARDPNFMSLIKLDFSASETGFAFKRT
ncbi:hypothetical protein SLS53_005033 [Cytospora paraplurivora]|uniref:MYND-type domain-containing protein n=1 Tax=Cytospora paraplurivora TaxID=2898453 RepID=A0AAN9U9A3_9PEZI